MQPSGELSLSYPATSAADRSSQFRFTSTIAMLLSVSDTPKKEKAAQPVCGFWAAQKGLKGVRCSKRLVGCRPATYDFVSLNCAEMCCWLLSVTFLPWRLFERAIRQPPAFAYSRFVEEEDLRELLGDAIRQAEELLQTLNQYRDNLLITPVLKMTAEDLVQLRETTEKIRAIEKFLAAQHKH